MTIGSYRQFCPVAMAAEILCTRWTVVLLRELVAGSTRFNELRRGVPRMSPALLSQRLKDLEVAGIVARKSSDTERGVFEYHLTAAGLELRPIVEAFGIWGQRRIELHLSLQHLDASASDVGHAAKSEHDSDADQAQCAAVLLSRAAGGATVLVADC